MVWLLPAVRGRPRVCWLGWLGGCGGVARWRPGVAGRLPGVLSGLAGGGEWSCCLPLASGVLRYFPGVAGRCTGVTIGLAGGGVWRPVLSPPKDRAGEGVRGETGEGTAHRSHRRRGSGVLRQLVPAMAATGPLQLGPAG